MGGIWERKAKPSRAMGGCGKKLEDEWPGSMEAS